jgi:hypothetical protein
MVYRLFCDKLHLHTVSRKKLTIGLGVETIQFAKNIYNLENFQYIHRKNAKGYWQIMGGLNSLDTFIRNNIECVAIWNKLDNFCQLE